MIFTKRHSPNNVFVEAFQLPIPFNKGVDWLAKIILSNNFIVRTEDNCITSVSKDPITIQSGDWIVKKEDDQIWLLSDQRMSDFFVYAPGQNTSPYMDISDLFNRVEEQSVQEQVVEKPVEVVQEQIVEETTEVVQEQIVEETTEVVQEQIVEETTEVVQESLTKPRYSRSRRTNN